MAPIVQLRRTGCQWTAAPDETALRGELKAGRAVVLPALIDRDVLAFLHRQIEIDGFHPYVHDTLPTRPSDLRLGPGPATALLLLLTNDRLFLDFVRRITGRHEIESFQGAVSRRMPTPDDRDEWHNDAVEGRRAALSINLSAGPFEGGILQIVDARTRTVVCEQANVEPGDAVLFPVDATWKHRVTTVTGERPRTVFAGWFTVEPRRKALGLE